MHERIVFKGVLKFCLPTRKSPVRVG